MKLVIEQSDFRQLSGGTQQEILRQLTGGTGGDPAKRRQRTDAAIYWRRPVDLSPALTVKLIHGLGEVHRKRLEVLAKGGGRASIKKLLAVTGDSDWRVLSHFQSVLTRRLRRLLDDPEKKAELIKWDFDTTRWDRDGKTIIDGEYYTSKATAEALKSVLVGDKPSKGGRRRSQAAARA